MSAWNELRGSLNAKTGNMTSKPSNWDSKTLFKKLLNKESTKPRWIYFAKERMNCVEKTRN